MSDVSTDEASISREFNSIFERFRELGLSNDALTLLESYKLLRHISNDCGASACMLSNLKRSSAGLTGLICLLLVIITISEKPITTLVGDLLIDSEDQCLLSTDSSVADIFRPPVNCAKLCHDVTNIDRVTLGELDIEQFYTRYAYSGRPVVVSGAMTNWSATKTFNFNYFRSLYAGTQAKKMSLDDCQFFAWGASEFATLHDAFQMDDDRARMKNGSKPWYFGWSNCDSSLANVLRSQYTRPVFLPESSESSGTDWIFMGSPGYGAPIHIDNVGNPSWQAQVTGSKQWILEPPPECYMECENRLEVTVNSGEIFFVDTNLWYHSTLVVGSQMSITIGSEYD